MPHRHAVFWRATTASARSGILWTIVVALSTATVLMQWQAGWTEAVAALLQCLMLATIIRQVERRPIATIQWWTRFGAVIRRRPAIAVASILLIMATSASHYLTLRESANPYTAGPFVWLSVELTASAAIVFFATRRRGSRVTVDLADTVSIFLALLLFNLLIGTLVSSASAARALAPELLRDNGTRLSMIILISTVVTLISVWGMSPAISFEERRPGRSARGYRWLDGTVLVLFALLTVHWVPRLS